MIVHEHIIQGSETWDDDRATRPTGSEYAKIADGKKIDSITVGGGAE